MNREQRRTEIKMLQKKGMKRNSAKMMVEQLYNPTPLEENQLVKLNMDLIERHPDWKNQREDFKAWVVAHKDDTFHVCYDDARAKRRGRSPKTLVTLLEDTTEPRWLFYSETLKPIASATVTLNNGEGVQIPLDGVKDPNDPIIMEKVNEVLSK